MSKSRFWIGWIYGYPWRSSGYTRWGRAGSLHIGPLCVQWPMPTKESKT